MSEQTAAKVTGGHLSRTAYLYVRQSTLRQVLTNTESGARQYALQQKAIALGWDAERVVTIDTDQGQSGASAADREGFQRLVAEVGMGRAGIVLGLEVSRLARNNADWHRLLEICAMSGTLICDEDGLYDPTDFNDRLLLGLKGTMSEAELHFIRARLIGGQLSKARRGELRMSLPVGLLYDPAGRIVLDPDTGVQQAIRHVFTLFARTGSARATVQQFNIDGLLFPVRVRTGAHKGELAWMPLQHCVLVLRVGHPSRVGEEPAGLGVFQPADGEPRVHRIALGDNRTHVVGNEHLEHPAEEPPRRFAAVDEGLEGLGESQPHEHVPRVDRGEDQRMHHPSASGHRIEHHAHPGEVDLALHPGVAVGDRHRGASASPIRGALRAITVQRALRHDHPAAGQQITDLHYRQAVLDPASDLIMAGAQRFPRRTMTLGAVRAHHGNHRADQLVTELINTTLTIQPRCHRGLNVAAGGLAVHPGPGGHHPQAHPQQPYPQHLTNLDHRNLPIHQRTTFTSIDVKRSEPVIERPQTRHAGWSHYWRTGGPMTLAKPRLPAGEPCV